MKPFQLKIKVSVPGFSNVEEYVVCPNCLYELVLGMWARYGDIFIHSLGVTKEECKECKKSETREHAMSSLLKFLSKRNI